MTSDQIIRNKANNRTVLIFSAGLLLAGAAHVSDRLLNKELLSEAAESHSALLAFGSTMLFVLNLCIYVFLVLYWISSLQMRLLPSKGRRYLIFSAVCMLFLLLIRAVKYRLAEHGSLLEHWCWYAFYVPLIIMPTMFLLTCISMTSAGKAKTRLRFIVSIFCIILIVFVFTNDLHKLMFIPYSDVFQNGAWGTYKTGILWYVFYSYILLCIITGLVFLAKIDRRQNKGARIFPQVITLFFFLGIMRLAEYLLIKYSMPSPWAFPEAATIITMFVFESCIRSRLIPYNENYVQFFNKMRFPALITDDEFGAVYKTESPINASAEQLDFSVDSSLELGDDIILYGKSLQPGYVFWTGNEKVIRELNDDLTDVSETLEAENDLLRYENIQKEERAHVDARNKVYIRAAEEVYPTQKKIAELIKQAEAENENDSEIIARILFLNAYVKRKTNFLLMSNERSTVPASDLFLALEESSRFLTLCGVNASVINKSEKQFSNSDATALYDSFELAAEALPAQTKGLLTTLTDNEIRMTAGCGLPENIPQTPAKLKTFYEDGQTYIIISVGRGEPV